MRNGRPDCRAENGGASIRASARPITSRGRRRATIPTALVVLEINGSTRRLTPEHAERVAQELRDAAEAARKQLAPGGPDRRS